MEDRIDHFQLKHYQKKSLLKIYFGKIHHVYYD